MYVRKSERVACTSGSGGGWRLSERKSEGAARLAMSTSASYKRRSRIGVGGFQSPETSCRDADGVEDKAQDHTCSVNAQNRCSVDRPRPSLLCRRAANKGDVTWKPRSSRTPRKGKASSCLRHEKLSDGSGHVTRGWTPADGLATAVVSFSGTHPATEPT